MRASHAFLTCILLSLFTGSLQGEEPDVKNGYLLTFKDPDGIPLAEARFLSAAFTSKVHPPRKVTATIRFLKNSSNSEQATWLQRLLKTGDAVPIEISTTSFETGDGTIIAETMVDFTPRQSHREVHALFMEHPLRMERYWNYGIASGGFMGGSVSFDRIHLAKKAGSGQPAASPEVKLENNEQQDSESDGFPPK